MFGSLKSPYLGWTLLELEMIEQVYQALWISTAAYPFIVRVLAEIIGVGSVLRRFTVTVIVADRLGMATLR